MNARILLKTPAVILAGCVFASLSLAGPGPQHWSKSTSKPVDTAAVTTNAGERPSSKCAGCKTTSARWVVSDRGGAGKGVPGAHLSGPTHSCTSCVGQLTTEKGKTKPGMKHGATCVALVCCK